MSESNKNENKIEKEIPDENKEHKTKEDIDLPEFSNYNNPSYVRETESVFIQEESKERNPPHENEVLSKTLDKTEPFKYTLGQSEHSKDSFIENKQRADSNNKTELFSNILEKAELSNNSFNALGNNTGMFGKTESSTNSLEKNEQSNNSFNALGNNTGMFGKTESFTNPFLKSKSNNNLFSDTEKTQEISEKTSNPFNSSSHNSEIFTRKEFSNNSIDKNENNIDPLGKTGFSNNLLNTNSKDTLDKKIDFENNTYSQHFKKFEPSNTNFPTLNNNSSLFGDKSVSQTFNNVPESKMNIKEESETPKPEENINSNPFAFMKEIEAKKPSNSDFSKFFDKISEKQTPVSLFGVKNDIKDADNTTIKPNHFTNNTIAASPFAETKIESGSLPFFNKDAQQNNIFSIKQPTTKLFGESNNTKEFINPSMESKPDKSSNQNTPHLELHQGKDSKISIFGETNPIFDKKYDTIFETETSKPKMDIKEISENHTTEYNKIEKETINKEKISEKKNIMEYLLLDFDDKEVINLIGGIIQYFNNKNNIILETGDLKQLMFLINKCKMERNYIIDSEIETEEEIKALFNSNSSFIFKSERLKTLFTYPKENKSLLLEVITFVIGRFNDIEVVFKDFYSYIFAIYLLKVLNTESTRKLSKTQIINILNTLVLLPVPYSILNLKFLKDISDTENTLNILKYINEKSKKENKQIKKLFNNYNSIYKDSVYAFNNIYSMNNNKKNKQQFRFAKIDEQIMTHYFSILGNLEYSIDYEDREIFISVLKTCDLSSVLKKHIIYCLNIDTHDFSQIELLIKKDELLRSSKKISKYYVKLIQELELNTFDLNLFNPSIFTQESLLIILKKININKLLENNYSTALVNTMNNSIYENIYLNIKKNGLLNFNTSLFLKLLSYKHLRFFQILKLLNQNISIPYILMNKELFSEQMFFNKEGFISYINFLSLKLDTNIKTIDEKNKNVPASKNYKGGTLLSKLMYGLIIEINEYIKKEEWECSKYLEQIGALIEVLPPSNFNNNEKEGNIKKKIKLTDKFYCIESNSDSFYNLMASRNLYYKKFISVKETSNLSLAFKNYYATKYLFSNISKFEVSEDKEKYKNDTKMQMIINLFTDQPIVPNNQLFIETFKEQKDPLIKYYSLKLIERKKDSQIFQLLNTELKTLIDCKGDCTKIVSDYYIKGLLVSILKCIDEDDIHFCDCIGFKDIKNMIRKKGELNSSKQ